MAQPPQGGREEAMATRGEGVCVCVRGEGGREREEGPGLTAPAIQGNTLYHTDLRGITDSSPSAVNTQPQPEDNRRSEAVSLIFKGFTANYVSIKQHNPGLNN